MKLSLSAFAMVIISLCTPLVSAQSGPPPGTDMDNQLSQMQKDMNAMLQQLATLRQQSKLQENILTMQSQLDKLQRTTDPNERQTLIQAHLDTLEAHRIMIEALRESERGSGSKTESAPAAPATSGQMRYGPGPMGFPGGTMYGPGMMSAPPGYPGGMVTPGRSMGNPPGGMNPPRYR